MDDELNELERPEPNRVEPTSYTDADGVERCDDCDEALPDCTCYCDDCGDNIWECAC